MADKIFVTKEGLKKLQDELKYLKEVKRVEIAEKLKEAISF
jgi:transcription elongation factor GreA